MERPPSFSILVYFDESRRPGVSLVFILPILILYEIGMKIVNLGKPVATINGADALLKQAMRALGFSGALLAAFCIVLTLVFLHMHRRLPWTVRPAVLVLMVVESVIVALPLFPLNYAVDWALLAAGWWPVRLLEQYAFMLGAGVYEEFLFRLVLLGGLVWAGLRIAGREHRQGAQTAAVLVSAVLFSAFHHLGPHGDAFTLRLFAIRTLAGVYFAWIYLARGFGVAVGCHTAYDLMVVTLQEMPG